MPGHGPRRALGLHRHLPLLGVAGLGGRGMLGVGRGRGGGTRVRILTPITLCTGGDFVFGACYQLVDVQHRDVDTRDKVVFQNQFDPYMSLLFPKSKR